VLVVGAGIAGIATSFFLLRETTARVLLVERDRVGCGASGHNAGQLTTYFERPLCDIADAFGWRLAAEAQRDLDEAHDLLDTMVGRSGARVRVERFTGYLGMFNRAQLEVHLRSLLVRRRADLPAYPCLVSEEAEFVDRLPRELDGLYEVVPQSRVRELLEIGGDRYRAVLAEPAGCSNSSVLCQQVLAHLQATYPDRFAYADHTKVERLVVSDESIVATAGAHRVTAEHVVLCTNGFVDHVVEDEEGSPLRLADDQRITGRVAYMAGFAEEAPRPPAAVSYIRNETIGGETPYVYVTRRTYDRGGDSVTLTCIGGPEYPHDASYERDAPFPGALLQALDDEARPFAQPARPAGLPYDFHWHGLMGYNDCGLRVVGAHPIEQRLLYNLGCNGVGFLPSIHGGRRIADLLAGRHVPESVFEPRRQEG
jgi:glycine/D-amino acid oxidase-like deaminating enzyme